MKKKAGFWGILSFIFIFSFARQAWAVCPICTVAVGAGVGLSRWLGIDDTITGTWVGALMVSLIFWNLAWFHKKNWNSLTLKTLAVFGWFALIMGPLFLYDIVGHAGNQLWGIDKLLLGIMLGSAIFLLGSEIHLFLKKRNHDKSFFVFQKVIVPITLLGFLSLFFYLTTK
ncbi:MAG: hypothetical protein ABIC19_02565 [Patescibacteria group bacterium]|nr:hypothetical protein [Patescibacteria group bacterium]